MPSLKDCLERTSTQDLRAVLYAVCEQDSRKHKFILNALENLDQWRKDTTNGTTNGKESSKKRKADGQLAICKACKEVFSPEENTKTCVYHDGETEADWDSDFWADHDEDCHGPIDSDWCRDEYPQGFIWTCCDRVNIEEARGCKRGYHSVTMKSDSERADDAETSAEESEDEAKEEQE